MVPLLRIGNHDNGERLDAVLARTYPQYSRAFFQKFMKKGGVTLAGAVREPSYRVRAGEAFQVADFEAFAMPVTMPPPGGLAADVTPDILFEDAQVLVIDKPAGLVVHPAPGHRVGTLMDWLKHHLGTSVVRVFTDPERLGLVHRLDKDTSGVLLIAKSIPAQTAIARQFHDRTVRKTYTAFIEGEPSAKTGVIDAPVGRSRKVPTRMAVSPLGRASETAFQVIESFKEVSQVSLQPKTGRTHQIRVHLAAIGHPIVGDRTYGSKSVWNQTYNIKRPLLHAERLEIAHPASGKRVTFEAPWPADFVSAQKTFRRAFVMLTVGLIFAWLTGTASAAEVTTTRKATAASSESASTHKTPSHTLSRISEISSDVHKLQKSVGGMEKQIAAIEDSVAELRATLEKANAADRIRDLERASADLNAKAVSSSSSAEETKAQLLDINRKLKNQQEFLDQLRDQLDRIKSQVIKQQAVGTPEPVPAAK
jgi:23S rRNA pseudouridine1911/1915/1917 synthase